MVIWWNGWYGSFGVSNIRGEIGFQNLKNLWVVKSLMRSYILFKILSFQSRITQNVFNTSRSNSLGQLIMLFPFQHSELMSCSFIRNCIAYSYDANIVNKDCPICEDELSNPFILSSLLWEYFVGLDGDSVASLNISIKKSKLYIELLIKIASQKWHFKKRVNKNSVTL